MEYFGNEKIIENYKTAFLCSRRCPSEIVLKSLDWAKSKKDQGQCVISCIHSRIERDVFEILLKGKQPLILVLARGMKERWPRGIRKAVDQERLLVISPFAENIKYVTEKTAKKRNQIMIDLADEVMLAYAQKNGSLEKLISAVKDKKIMRFQT